MQDHSIGMGLANSQLIAKSMDGSIRLCESQKEFTHISFTLPFQQQEENQIVETKIPKFQMIKDWTKTHRMESRFDKLKEYLLVNKI